MGDEHRPAGAAFDQAGQEPRGAGVPVDGLQDEILAHPAAPEAGGGALRLHLGPAPGEVQPLRPRRGPRQHEPRQHVGLELLQLLRRGQRPDITQVPYDSQRQPEPPHLQPDREPIGHGENASGIPKLRQPANNRRREDEPPPGHEVEDAEKLRATRGMSHISWLLGQLGLGPEV